MDPKSRKCIFLGFEKGVKGYRFWDLISKKKVINKDIIFDETIMLKQNEAEVCEDSPKAKSIVEVEFDEDNLPIDKGNDEDVFDFIYYIDIDVCKLIVLKRRNFHKA